MESHKDLLDMWLPENEGTKFLPNTLPELPNREIKDILNACVDGLKGFPEEIKNAFPQIHIQLCIV